MVKEKNRQRQSCRSDKKILNAAIKMNNIATTGLNELKSAMIDINNSRKGSHEDY